MRHQRTRTFIKILVFPNLFPIRILTYIIPFLIYLSLEQISLGISGRRKKFPDKDRHAAGKFPDKDRHAAGKFPDKDRHILKFPDKDRHQKW